MVHNWPYKTWQKMSREDNQKQITKDFDIPVSSPEDPGHIQKTMTNLMLGLNSR